MARSRWFVLLSLHAGACSATGTAPGGPSTSPSTGLSSPPSSSPPLPSEPFVTAEWSDTQRCPVPEDTCGRESGWADWPGGRRIHLEAGKLAPGEPLTLTASAARPGDSVSFYRGSACALDCPAHLDGACFQPVAPIWLGEALADATGLASLTLTPDAGWGIDWQLIQAAVEAPASGLQPYLSQPILDRVGPPAPFAPPLSTVPFSAITVRSQRIPNSVGATWTSEIGAGHRISLLFVQDPGFGSQNSSLVVVTERSTSTEDWDWGEQSSIDTWSPARSRLTLYTGTEISGDYLFSLDTPPLDTPVDWYPDRDCDGYGDGDTLPLSSAVPVLGGSPLVGDCDDDDPLLKPLAGEICGDGVDQDCDGVDRPCARSPGEPISLSGTRLVGAMNASVGSWLTAADLDGDGTDDLASHSGRFALERRDQRLEAPYPVPYALSGVAADFDGDGVADLVLDDFQDLVFMAGPVTLSSSRPEPLSSALPLTASSWGLAASDVTGDGVVDLLAAGGPSSNPEITGVALYSGPLAPPLGLPVAEIDNRYRGTRITSGDADGDGINDVWTHDVCLYSSPLPLAGAAPEGCARGDGEGAADAGLAAGDIDGDGLGDVLVGARDASYILLGPLRDDKPIEDLAWWMLTYDDGLSVSPGGAVAIVPPGGDGSATAVISGNYRVWAGAVLSGGAHTEADGEILLTSPREYTPALLGGDFDGDSLGDLAIGDSTLSYEDDPYTGVIYVLWGS